MPVTYDVHIQPLELDGEEQIFSFAYTAAVGVTGTQKLLNRWLKCLFTEKGSDPSDIQYGTTFPSLIGGNATSIIDVRDVIFLAIEDCNAQIRRQDRLSGYAADEALHSATLTKLETPSGPGAVTNVRATVEFRSVAGGTFVFALPVAPTTN